MEGEMKTRPKFHDSGRLMDYSGLDERFTPYYESRERVEVEWEDGWGYFVGYGLRTNGEKLRFYVGRSTGWRPTYIMLLRRDSISGMAVGFDGIKSIKGLGVYR